MAKPKTPQQLPASEPGAAAPEQTTPPAEEAQPQESEIETGETTAEPETPQQLPASEPGAAAPEETSPQAEETQTQEPEVKASETTDPEPSTSGPAPLRYRVNNRFEGFRDEALNEGDVVEATADEAAPFLGGVLTLLDD